MERGYSPPRIAARTGWCSDRWAKEHHPGGVHKRRLRAIFLVTPPPLLAVMRGGEFALFKRSPPPHIAVSAALDAPFNDLRYRPCRLRISQSKRNAITGSRPVTTY